MTKIKVRKKSVHRNNATDINLLVSPDSTEELLEWNRDRITDALRHEAGMSKKSAEEVACAVERKVLASDIRTISSSLIRELVDNELFEKGLQHKLQQQQSIGLPKYDIEELIFSKSRDNSNVTTNNPEAIGFTIAETISKQYALKEIFSPNVAQAHKEGLIYLHDLGHPTRAYCGSHSLEYIKKYGLTYLDNLDSSSAPAKHGRTLTTHLNTFLAVMQMYYAGALGVAYVNVMYAPYLVGMSREEIKQEAQHLIFQTSQNAFSRGGQSLFIDFNIHSGVPGYLKNVPAVGPGGKPTGKTYDYYEDIAIQFAKEMLDIWGRGDCFGRPMAFPKAQFHISHETFENENQRELFEYACGVAAKNGSIYFVFDRDEVTLSSCCRLKTAIDDRYMIDHPESLRFTGFQNVTMNLPQCAYRSGGDYDKFLKSLEESVDLCVQAHKEKKDFVGKLMSRPELPMWQVGKKAKDGRPYIDLEAATYIIGIIGLNECVKYLFGCELHESDEALWRGLKIVSYLHLYMKEQSVKHGLKLSIEESPAESAARRLAKIDLRNFPDDAIVRGDPNDDDIYYTNSIHIRPDADVDIIDRITKQSKFHKLIESGAIIHAFVGEKIPSGKSIAKLVHKIFRDTDCAQFVISPEFTICSKCNTTTMGLVDSCPKCGVRNVIINRVADGVRVSKWSIEKLLKLSS